MWRDSNIKPKVIAGGFSGSVLVAVVCDNGMKFVTMDKFDHQNKKWIDSTERNGRRVSAWRYLPKFPEKALTK